jgi:hypothetical protein
MARRRRGEDGDAAARPQELPSVSAHPRARRSISRAKAWGALIAFGLVALLSYNAGVPVFEVGVRALAAGVAAYLIVWAGAVALWQRLIVHELKVETERRREEAEAEQERRRAEREAAAAADEGAVA